MTELKDKRLEAASDIEHAGSGYFRTRTERFDQILTTALRVTGADELADFLAEALAHFENGIIPLDSMIENMQAALDRYKELKP